MAVKFKDSFHVYVYIIVVVVLIYYPDHSNGAQYLVGGEDYKWSIPLTNDFYTNWSSSHAFVVGDTLLFDYDPELHNLFQVSGREFKDCTADQAFNVYHSPASVRLMEQGVFYYVCTVLNYCSLGQKLMVSVVKSPPPPAASPSSPTPSPLVLEPFLQD
ncbi:mavicyanin-like [Apium graveolens]|uniref:mavicyanin-like n=1 Tax=Apium graveolens TaxID=4045 RepID=UPI003D7B0214